MPHINKNKDVNKITVICVNYNVAKNVNKLINSLILIDEVIEEIIIIDNNSIDKSKIKPNSKTKVITNNINVGFSKAVNQGIKMSKSKFILLINPDCYLVDKSIIGTINYIKTNSKIGAIGGKIINPITKKYQFSANSKATFLTGLFEFTNLKKIFPNNVFSQKFWIENIPNLKPIFVESLCGAYMIIRKKLNNNINLFDESFFLYLEDIDFGNKINNQNFKVVFDPSSTVVHLGGKSSNSKYNIVLPEWYKSRKIYFKKHLSTFKYIILLVIFTFEEVILDIIIYAKKSFSHSPHKK